MPIADTILFDGDTELNHYQVVETTYERRPARVLYSGRRTAAQSGIALDGNTDLLFDYNQRFFELISGMRPRCILLIGGGVYTLPTAVLAAFPDISIDVVELDGGLDEIAERFFDLRPNPRLRIVHGDGRQYLEANNKPYDMILVDAFNGTDVAPSLVTVEAAQQLARNLTPGGVVAMNTIVTYRGRNMVIRRQCAAFAAAFDCVEAFPAGHGYTTWLPQNVVLCGSGQTLAPYMRYEKLPALETSVAEALRDEDMKRLAR